MTPRLISGWPNFAVSAAMMKSQSMASSQPAAQRVARDGGDDRLSDRADAGHWRRRRNSPCTCPCRIAAPISLMSAPAAKARSEPVSTMQRTSSPQVHSSSTPDQFAQQLGVERVQRLGTIERDRAHAVFDLHEDVLIFHVGLHFPAASLAQARRERKRPFVTAVRFDRLAVAVAPPRRNPKASIHRQASASSARR